MSPTWNPGRGQDGGLESHAEGFTTEPVRTEKPLEIFKMKK